MNIHQLIEIERKHGWKPFTQMQDYLAERPLVIERAEGIWLYDTEGNRYLDGVSSLWANLLGHRVPEIDAAIRDQLDKMAHVSQLGPTHPTAMELCGELAAIAPDGLTRVFFSDNGSTAVEVAMKLAHQYWIQRSNEPKPEKTKFLSFEHGYHGDTLGATSLGGIDLFHDVYRPLCKPAFLAKLYTGPEGEASLEDAQRILKTHHSEIAALVIEPKVQGAGGMKMQPEGFLRQIRNLCDRYDVLWIADEVMTGFGRTGKMFACDLEEVSPDLMAVGKGLTGGYTPLAATLATEKIFEAFLGEYRDVRTFFHGHTYTGHPLGCAAALATLRLLKEKKIVESLPEKIDAMREALSPLADHRHVARLRQTGLIAAFDLVKDKSTGEAFDWTEQMGYRLCDVALGRGVWIRPLGSTILLMPPLTITAEEIRWFSQKISDSVFNMFPQGFPQNSGGFPRSLPGD